ncbi:MAG: hypothetical protein LBU07_03915 [Coriobacteriales bacterium]|nr:hypothetical protein [Coriobacteriales bacterium]
MSTKQMNAERIGAHLMRVIHAHRRSVLSIIGFDPLNCFIGFNFLHCHRNGVPVSRSAG